MPLQKQTATFSFSKGIDTKSDPKQLPLGKLVDLQNGIFTQTGSIIKRPGYDQITSLPDSSFTFLSTFSNDLVAIGDTFQTYSSATQLWTNHGNFNACQLSVLSCVRNATNQSQCDSVTSPSGLTCITYTDQDPANLSNNIYSYTVIDSNTGVTVVPPTKITAADATNGTPKVFLLSSWFIVVFGAPLVAGHYQIKFFGVSTSNPTTVSSTHTIATTYTPSTNVAFDGAVFNNALYLAWNYSGINIAYITNSLSASSVYTPDALHNGTMISVQCQNVALSLNLIWITYYDSGTTNGYSIAVNSSLTGIIVNPTKVIDTKVISNLTSLYFNANLSIFYEVANNYSWTNGPATNYLNKVSITNTGSVGSTTTIARSVGLASKAFLVSQFSGSYVTYFLVAYQSNTSFQNTYFLMNESGQLIAKIAYQNGCGYITKSLPNVSVQNNIAYISYLYKFAISSVAKDNSTKAAALQQTGVYAQQGINQVQFNFDTSNIFGAELGGNLHITGGFLWAYDGNTLSEQNFHLWPDLDIAPKGGTAGNTSQCFTITNGSGSIPSTNNLYYIGVYEWQDLQGNIHRSGISIQAFVKKSDLTDPTSNTVVCHFPTLRLTYKTGNTVKLTLYRASDAQQTFYQVTQIASPTLNSTSVDSIDITDTYSDAQILGNPILYTTGGVLENTGGQACNSIDVFDNRLFTVSSEDPNVLNFSQIVIDQTPVEMSLFLTRYISPTVGAEGSTGPNRCLAVMDDKQVMFKDQAIIYMNGTGPSATGQNSNYSEPYFVTATVGCSNDNSIAYTPMGLLFQANNGQGIWLLTRDLNTKYIGADVESYNSQRVVSANAVPGSTFVVFTMSSGITLMYDWYYNQWGTFYGITSYSSTIYQGLHTYIDNNGVVYQQSPGSYLDGGRPVLMKIQTGWINLNGIQGLQRAWWLFLLGTYQSPHYLFSTIAYDYNPNPAQGFNLPPQNTSTVYGQDTPYGNSSVYGGFSPLEQFRINLEQQKCQAFQIMLQEIYNPSSGIPAGAGLTFSAATIVYGQKKGYPRVSAALSVG